MSKRMNNLSKGQRGFTLIELLGVMAILAVLVAVVAPAVAGTRNASLEAQALTDATMVRTAANKYFSKINEAEVRTPHSITTVTLVGGTVASAQQVTSNRWPELYITTENATTFPAIYANVFETTDTLKVDKVSLLDENSDAMTANLFERFTAIDLDTLEEERLLLKQPAGVDYVSSSNGIDVPNFLWLFEKTSSSSATEAEDDSREVAVFSLVKVVVLEETAESDGGVLELTYKRIF